MHRESDHREHCRQEEAVDLPDVQLEHRAQDREDAAEQEHVVQQRKQRASTELEAGCPAPLYSAEPEGKVQQDQGGRCRDRERGSRHGLTRDGGTHLVKAALVAVNWAHLPLQIALELVWVELRRLDDEAALT